MAVKSKPPAVRVAVDSLDTRQNGNCPPSNVNFSNHPIFIILEKWGRIVLFDKNEKLELNGSRYHKFFIQFKIDLIYSNLPIR
jgi:hypothetical protein